MADNTLQLVILVDTGQGNAELKTFNVNLSNVGKTAGSATAVASSGMDSFTKSIAKGVVAGYSLVEVAKLAADTLKRFTLGSIDIAAEIGRAAQKTGLTTEALSGLRLAAEDSNVEFASLSTGLARFGKNAFEAVTGNKALKEKFDSLGISLRDSSGQIRPMGDLVSQLADRFAGMADGPEKDAAAIKLLGRSGQELIPVLNLGAKGLADFSKEADEYGLIVNGITAKEAIQFNANLKDLRNLLVAVGIAVGENLLPSFINLTRSMLDWVKEAAGVQIIAGYIASAFRIMATATILAAVEFSEFTSDVVRGLDLMEKALNFITLPERVLFGKGQLVNAKTLADNKTALGILQQQRDDLGKLLISFNAPSANLPSRPASVVPPRKTPPEPAENAKRIAEASKSAREFLVSAEEASLATAATIKKDFLDPFSASRAKFLDEAGKAILEANKETEKLSTFVDDKGVVQRIKLTADARENIEQALHIKLTSLQNQYYAEEIKLARKGFELKIEQDSKLYLTRLKLETDFLLKQRENSDKLIAFQEDQAGFLRDAKLRALEAEDAQTLPQKLAAEKRKADIEVEYIKSTAAVRAKLFDMETDRELAALRLKLDLEATNPAERVAGLAAIQEIANQRGQIAITTAEKTQAEIDAITQGASNKQVQLAREHYRQIFDSLKQAAGGVFDALLTKSQSVFSAIGNALKTAVLTAIKEIVTSRVAALLLQLLTGAHATFSPSGGGVQIAGGGGGILGGLAGILGLGQKPEISTKLDQPNHLGDLGLVGGAVPVIITNSPAQQVQQATQAAAQTSKLSGIAAALGGLIGLGSIAGKSGIPGGAVSSTIDYGQGAQAVGSATYPGVAGTPPILPTGASNASGLAGLLGNLKGFAGIGGSIQTGAGTATTWGAATLGHKLGALGKSNAALLGGGLLVYDGLRRGGLAGLGETTAGGALIGFKFGGPIGAVIGAGIGALAGIARLFIKSAKEKLREKIKATYGVDMKDQGILQQIADTAKQSFGGNLDVAIRSPQIRDLIQLYAMTVGQSTKGMPATMHAGTLVETGGGLFQAPNFQNGSALPSLGGSLSTIGLGGVSGANASSAGPSVTTINVPLNLDGKVLAQHTIQVVSQNGRVVSASASSGVKASAGRRELTALQLSPGTLTS